jgi:hypothetical protein
MKTIRVQRRFVNRRNLNNHVVPEIRISGKWIEDMGFKIGDDLQIIYRSGEIRIIAQSHVYQCIDLYRHL